ncbi:MAG: sulfatase [Rikenellaceae bacterium]
MVSAPHQGVAAEVERSDRPNFIIILTDDQGYNDLGCFGSPNIKTPNVDRMASEGMRLTDFYAQPVSGPSRQSLATGCYPIRCARKDNDFSARAPTMSSSEVTIAEMLKDVGYSTHMIGKWDLAGHNPKTFDRELTPMDQGFDGMFWTPSSNDKYVDLYRDRELIEPDTDMSQLTRRYTDEALRFIEESQDEPFFLYLAHTMPHVKLAVSDEFRGKSDGGLFGDVVEEIDYNVGRILDLVTELGLDENTYIIYTSDNGPWWIKKENAGHADPLRGAKTSTWDGGMRVPCIVRAVGRVPAGATCDLVTSTIDILPTFAALAGGEVPQDRVIDGLDLSKVLAGKQRKLDRAFFFYQHTDLRAVRYGKWKLHLPHDDYHTQKKGLYASLINHIAPADRPFFTELTLYDLDSDIGETTNVAAENPKVVKKLMKMLDWASQDSPSAKSVCEP